LFAAQAGEVARAGDSAHVAPFVSADSAQEAGLRAAFDRTGAYPQGPDAPAALRTELPKLAEPEARRRLAAVRRELEAIAATDFFPGRAHPPRRQRRCPAQGHVGGKEY
jgi:hypothetical protein